MIAKQNPKVFADSANDLKSSNLSQERRSSGGGPTGPVVVAEMHWRGR